MTYRAYLIPAKGRAILLPPGKFAERELNRGVATACGMLNEHEDEYGRTVEIAVVRYPDRITVRNKLIRKQI